MRNSPNHWPRSPRFFICWAFVPGLTSLAQEREMVFEQVIGQPRGLPKLSPQGEWVEVINATSRWVVVQNPSGQQFPIAVDGLGQFLVRWPSSLDALTEE